MFWGYYLRSILHDGVYFHNFFRFHDGLSDKEHQSKADVSTSYIH